MIDNFSEKIIGTSPTPAAEYLFAYGKGGPLPNYKASKFHTIISKNLFVCKRTRPDIHPTAAALCNRV